MLNSKTVALLIAALAMGLSPVFADTMSPHGAFPPDTTSYEISQLEAAKALAERNEKDSREDVLTQVSFEEQEKAINRMINRLRAGAAVSADEIREATAPPTITY
jgi:hypothetical protein